MSSRRKNRLLLCSLFFLASSPSLADAYEVDVNMKVKRFTEDKLVESQQLALRLLEIEPDSFDAAYFLANIYAKTNRPAEAAELYKKALEQEPRNERLANQYLKAVLATGNEEQIDKAKNYLNWLPYPTRPAL